jgi:hypothetical protein
MSTITINVTSSVSTGADSGYFNLPGNFTSIFYPGYVFQLTNQQNQNLTYTVVSSSFTGGVTQVNVGSALQGSIVSFTFTPGTAPYVTGYYQNVQTQGGSGNSAIVNVTVLGPGTINAFGGITSGTAYTIGTYVGVPLITIAGPIATLGSVTGGSSYTNGTYTNILLTGGTGTGAAGTIVVSGNAVSSVTITTAGVGYTIADSLSALASTIGGTGSGFVVGVSTITTGTGATGSIAVNSQGGVYSVTLMNPGTGYMPGDILSANPNFDSVGSGSGFSIPVVNVLAASGTQVTATLVDGGIGYLVGNTITFTGPFGTNSIINPTMVTTNELGSITLSNTIPMFNINQTVYVINELPAIGNNINRWWPATPQAPAVQSGTVLQSTITATDLSNSPQIMYAIRLSGLAGTQTFNQTTVYVDKPTAIAAYEALSL